jgi:hypothetical protein
MGRRLRLSGNRRLIDDLLQVANRFPSAGLIGDFDASEIANLRRKTRPKISWNVLYMKAYAIVADNYPELRQIYVNSFRPFIYQHHDNVCMLTINREYEGEERLFFARFNNPQEESLTDLQERYDYLRRAPLNEIKQFRHQIRFSKAPRLIRKLGWWIMLNCWPTKRANHMGTFGMSLSTYKNVYGTKHLGPLTTILGVDATPRKGSCKLVLTFDHRVLDGVPAAATLPRVHQILTTTIRDELAQIIGVDAETGQPLPVEEKPAFLWVTPHKMAA